MRKPDGYDEWFERVLLPVPETNKFFAKHRPVTLPETFGFDLGCVWSFVIHDLLEQNDIHVYFKNVWYLNELLNFDFSSLNQIQISGIHKGLTSQQTQKVKEYNKINPEKPLPVNGWSPCDTNKTKRDFIKFFNEGNSFRHDFLPMPPFGRFVIKCLYDAYVQIEEHIDNGKPFPDRIPKWGTGKNPRFQFYKWGNYDSLSQSEKNMQLIASALGFPLVGLGSWALFGDTKGIFLPALYCDGSPKHREFVERYEKRFNPQTFNLQAELRKPKIQRQPDEPFLQFPTFDNIPTPESTKESLWDWMQKNKGNGK